MRGGFKPKPPRATEENATMETSVSMSEPDLASTCFAAARAAFTPVRPEALAAKVAMRRGDDKGRRTKAPARSSPSG